MEKINDADFKSKLWKNIKERELQTQRGRLVFYPTFFNRLGLEMINKHSRKRKAGKTPVYYEVVPRGVSGNFQLLYIPADGLADKTSNRTEEINKDIALLDNALKRIFCESKDHVQVKIGAKTKLGWGKTKTNSLNFIKRKDDSIKIPERSLLKEYTEVENV
jgi:CRISPR-associated protein Cmr2